MEAIIDLSNRRLQVPVLQTLSIKDFSHWLSAHRPKDAKLKSLLEFVGSQNPSGNEQSRETKFAATRFIAVKLMLLEYYRAPNTAVQEKCLQSTAEWFQKTNRVPQNLNASPNKSPQKKSVQLHVAKANTAQLFTRPQTSENREFKQKDVLESHLQRLEHRYAPEEFQCKQDEARKLFNGATSGQSMTVKNQRLSEMDVVQQDMKDLWLENRNKNKLQEKNKDEVKRALTTWSYDKSRNTGDLLRRQETTQMMTNKLRYDREMSKAAEDVEILEEEMSNNCEEEENVAEEPQQAVDQAEAKTNQPVPVAQEVPILELPTKKKKSYAPQVIKKTGMRFRNPLPPSYNTKSKPAVVKAPSTPATPAAPNREAFPLDEVDHSTSYPRPFNSMMGRKKKVNQAPVPNVKQGSFRGSLPFASTPNDAELKLFHYAKKDRQPDAVARGTSSFSRSTIIAQTTDEIDQGRLNHIRQQQSIARAASAPTGGSRKSIIQRRMEERKIDQACSELRREQMTELDQIRQAFAKHNLSFNDRLFERALIIPEDREDVDCAKNLPVPGSSLAPNPFLKQKNAVYSAKDGTKSKLKKKKKKGKKTIKKKIVK